MISEELAWKIRRHGIEMAHLSGGSHVASVLSIADIVAVLYTNIMSVFPNEPKNDKRDRFILSKGHAGAAVYSALAELGFFSISELKNYCANGSILSGHVSHRNVPGVEFSTGALGHGIGIGAGMALAAKHDNKEHKVFVVMGDGECNEGSVWESVLFASHFHLNNLYIIIDNNRMQGLGFCDDCMNLQDLAQKWISFGWEVFEVNGHDHDELKKTIKKPSDNKPVCIIANTIKGKGISFMENNILWHYKSPQNEDYNKAVQELEAAKNEK